MCKTVGKYDLLKVPLPLWLLLGGLHVLEVLVPQECMFVYICHLRDSFLVTVQGILPLRLSLLVSEADVAAWSLDARLARSLNAADLL